MEFNKTRFLEDLRGLNGDAAQELAFAEVEKYIDLNFGQDEVEFLKETIAELETEIIQLQEERNQLLNYKNRVGSV